MALISTTQKSFDEKFKIVMTKVCYVPLKPFSFDSPQPCHLSINGSKWTSGLFYMERYTPFFGTFEGENFSRPVEFGFLLSVNGNLNGRIITLSYQNGSVVRLKVASIVSYLEVLENATQFIRSWESPPTPVVLHESVSWCRKAQNCHHEQKEKKPDLSSKRKRSNDSVEEETPTAKKLRSHNAIVEPEKVPLKRKLRVTRKPRKRTSVILAD